MSELTTKFDSLEAGDKIVVPQYANPLTVVEVLESVGIVELEGQRGGEKSLVQNKNNPENIALMAGADKKGYVNEFEIVHKESTEEDDDETGTYEQPDGTPKKTGREVSESTATVRVDETTAPNGRVVIHVENAQHDGGTRSFFRNRHSDVERSIRSHLQNELSEDVVRVEVIDAAGVGISGADLVPEPTAIEATTAEVVVA